jgi:hypothetical protein
LNEDNFCFTEEYTHSSFVHIGWYCHELVPANSARNGIE